MSRSNAGAARGRPTTPIEPEPLSGLAGAVHAGARRIVATTPALPSLSPRGETKERLLLVALELFASQGFHGTSIRDIARALGIQPASVYSHIPSKEHLLADLVLLGHEAHARHIRDALDAAPADPSSQLAAVTAAHVQVHARWSMLCVVTNTELHALPPELARPSLDIRQSVSRLMTDIVTAGQQDGTFDVPDVMLVVAAIAAMGMRVATWFDADGTHTEQEVVDAYVLLALRMAGAQARGPETTRAKRTNSAPARP